MQKLALILFKLRRPRSTARKQLFCFCQLEEKAAMKRIQHVNMWSDCYSLCFAMLYLHLFCYALLTSLKTLFMWNFQFHTVISFATTTTTTTLPGSVMTVNMIGLLLSLLALYA